MLYTFDVFINDHKLTVLMYEFFFYLFFKQQILILIRHYLVTPLKQLTKWRILF
jgi:hypothetical protein